MHNKETAAEILQVPIKELPVSEIFRLRSKLMGFQTLKEITESDKVLLRKKEDFSYRWLRELLSVLETYGLTDLMDRSVGDS